MECLWLEDKKISVKNVPPPTPTKEEALIRLLLAGICRTDIEMQRGYHSFAGVPGHEFVGEVMHAPGDPSWEGKRVVGEINIACGESAQVGTGYADLVVEASGTPEGLDLARKAVRPRGTIVLKSTYSGSKGLDLSSWVVDEITLVGSRCGPFTPALRLLEKSLVDPIPLVEARYPLSKGDRAFEHAQKPGVLKVLLHPS